MDDAQLNKWKSLANDAVIATFGTDTRESQLAQALEQAVEALDEMSNNCDSCSICESHGNKDGQGLVVDIGEVLLIQKQLKNQMKALKNYHVRLAGDLSEWKATGEFGINLAEDLAGIIEQTEDYVDELEAEILP